MPAPCPMPRHRLPRPAAPVLSCLRPETASAEHRLGNAIKRPARPRGDVQSIRMTANELLCTSPGDHGRIIAAQLKWRRVKSETAGLGELRQRLTEPLVRRYATSDHQVPIAPELGLRYAYGPGAAVGHHIRYGSLEAGTEVADVFVRQRHQL